MILEVHEFIDNGYLLESKKGREYDCEGRIISIKATYIHQLNLEDDAIKNCDDLTQVYQRLKKWHVLSKMEKKWLSMGLPQFYSNMDLEVMRIEKWFQNFDELYQEYVKKEKAKDIKETSVLHQDKRRKVHIIEPSSSTSTFLS